MSKKRNPRGVSTSRDSGGFVALPWQVLDSAAYRGLSHPARSLLLEIARQYVSDNNGKLLASRAHLLGRGWKSADVIDRAKHELLEAGFIHETVKGSRPNKASWYALTWFSIDRLPGFDEGAIESFRRGAYKFSAPPKNAPLVPSGGTVTPSIGPSGGTRGRAAVPSGGTIRVGLARFSVPSDGHHLEKPSASGFTSREVTGQGMKCLVETA